MAAEDWIDDYYPDPFDHEQDLDEGPLPSSPLHVCKYCGKGFLHWVSTSRGYRLYEPDNTMHKCVFRSRRSSPMTLAQAAAIITTPVVSSTPSPRSPIMDKNAVAFIRSDVRSIKVVFINSAPGDRGEASLESWHRLAQGQKKYTYLTIDPDIAPGDWVVVMASGIPKAVFVVEVDEDLSIEPNMDYACAYIISPVNFKLYDRLLRQNKKIEDTLRESYKASLRAGFRETLLSGLPAEKQAALTLILNGDEPTPAP